MLGYFVYLFIFRFYHTDGHSNDYVYYYTQTQILFVFFIVLYT